MSKRILLVEDEPGLVLTLGDRLAAEGYAVETAGDGERGFHLASTEPFDLVILDVMLPKRDGFEVCQSLRRANVSAPILMLTARGEVLDKVLGLKLGADDYVTKPFDMLELLARVEALMRRAPAGTPSEIAAYRFGDVHVDFRAAEVTRAGEPVEVTPRELGLLRYFVERRGEVVTRNELLDAVWGYSSTVMTRTVDVHVALLRQKLEETPRYPRYILTVHGTGYKFAG
jgi:two-component system alkaline phosphatase synthesis response regulator PhoP